MSLYCLLRYGPVKVPKPSTTYKTKKDEQLANILAVAFPWQGMIALSHGYVTRVKVWRKTKP